MIMDLRPSIGYCAIFPEVVFPEVPRPPHVNGGRMVRMDEPVLIRVVMPDGVATGSRDRVNVRTRSLSIKDFPGQATWATSIHGILEETCGFTGKGCARCDHL
ncbi:hypothetical protein [Herbidospora cretacea]|uniref:hypothetical protein n=1 Tax=Herbidospora cretacea TaxID=28444 RepID=UPI000AA59350|nr:hypothetical protein [Herbidospora cretacea]